MHIVKALGAFEFDNHATFDEKISRILPHGNAFIPDNHGVLLYDLDTDTPQLVSESPLIDFFQES
jgi:hypothetical protein